MKITSLFFILLLHSFAASAFTYYVSPSGDDDNDGLSLSNAFQTLQHVSDIVQPGDHVYVHPGTYTGFYHTTSGNSTDRIIFSALPGVIIDVPNAITNDGINLEGSSFITIEGFKVTSMPRAGIRSVINDGVIIRDNHCTLNGKWGILTGFSENILIEHNICEYSVDEHGIYFGNSADNPVIRKNTCRYNHANGIHMNADAELEGDGIISGALVEKNIIYENGEGGGSGINCDGVQNSYISNNLIYDNHASGISLYMIDAAEPCNGTVVVNNTIYQPDDARWALNITNGSSDVVVFNNILLSDHAFRGSITADPTVLLTLQSDYNIFSDRMSVDDGDNNMTVSEWQSTTGLDTHSGAYELAEVFYDLPTDLPIIFGPAMDHGIDIFSGIEAPITDIVDFNRPFGEWDMGCYEIIWESVEETLATTFVLWSQISLTTKLTLYDMSGRAIVSGSKEDITNKVSYPDGVYLFTGDARIKGKVMIVNGVFR